MNWFKRLFAKNNQGTSQKETSAEHIGVLEEMRRIKPLVIEILTEHPQTKDDDTLLLTMFWENQVKFPIKSYGQFSYLLVKKWLTTPETITRTRRKVQEQYPHLRGKLYEKRKNAEREISKQLSMDFE
jgi:hypothetical protein